MTDLITLTILLTSKKKLIFPGSIRIGRRKNSERKNFVRGICHKDALYNKSMNK